MLIWCLCPIVTQVSNGGSPISPTFNQIISWGLPYLVGRLYVGSLDGLRQLAIGILAGGLAYIPFTLIEGVKGPILHQMVYGVSAFDDWSQAVRAGGWRPVVFMQHGLMVGVWMMTAALIAVWFWQTGDAQKVSGSQHQDFSNYINNRFFPVPFYWRLQFICIRVDRIILCQVVSHFFAPAIHNWIYSVLSVHSCSGSILE
jgi:hypothetical protein